MTTPEKKDPDNEESQDGAPINDPRDLEKAESKCGDDSWKKRDSVEEVIGDAAVVNMYFMVVSMVVI